MRPDRSSCAVALTLHAEGRANGIRNRRLSGVSPWISPLVDLFLEPFWQTTVHLPSTACRGFERTRTNSARG
jgi:hypothetical protein